MKCTNCGKDLNPNSKFCDNCGAPVQFQPVQPTQNTTVPTAQGSAPQPKKEPWYMNKKIVLPAVAGIIILFLVIGIAVTRNRGPVSTTSDSDFDISEDYDDSNDSENESEETPVKFEKGQIYKEHKCKISVKGGENDTIKFYIENNSKKDYNFYIHSCSINGIMTDCNTFTMNTDIPAKKKANAELDLSSWIDDDTGTIEYVDVLFWAYNDLMKSYDTGILRIKTDAFSKERKSFDEGEPKKEFNKLSVSYCGEEDNKLYFAVVNNNNYMVDYNLDNCSINGWAFDTDIQVYDREIYPNSKDYFAIEVDDDFIEKNSIKKFKNIEFNLEVSPYGDVFKQFSTKKFKLKLS